MRTLSPIQGAKWLIYLRRKTPVFRPGIPRALVVQLSVRGRKAGGNQPQQGCRHRSRLQNGAAASDGFDLDDSNFYRDLEVRLGDAQRRGDKRAVKTIHARIKNRRKDSLHKYSRAVVDGAGGVFVGNISAYWQISRKGKICQRHGLVEAAQHLEVQMRSRRRCICRGL